jgi:hypothetical protein
LIFVGSIPDIYGVAEDSPFHGSRAGAAYFQPSNSVSGAEGWPYLAATTAAKPISMDLNDFVDEEHQILTPAGEQTRK